jgi:SPP1 gp7 family putative phage head morphogenesis protein
MSILRATLTIESERVRLQNYAVGAVARFGDTARRHAVSAVRIGADPVKAARDVLWGNTILRLPGITETVSRGLVGSHLLGLRRTALAARQHYGHDVLTLSRAGDKMDAWMRKLADVAAVTEAETASLFQRARAVASGLVQRITAPLFRRVASAPQTAAPVGESVAPRVVVEEMRRQFEKAGFVPGAEYGIAGPVGDAMTRSYESGRARGWRTAAVSEKLWGLHYSAILDGRTTELCRGLDGTTLPLADPFWSQWTPPNHFGCRSAVVEVWKSSRLREPPATLRNYERFGPDFFIG